MGRTNALVVCVLLALAGVAGTYATIQTLGVGKQAQSEVLAPGNVIAGRKQKLDRWEDQLNRAATKRPPSLPGIPQYGPVAMPNVAPVGVSTAARVSKPASAPKTSAPKQKAPKAPKPKPAPGDPDVIYVPSDPTIVYTQPVAEKTCSEAEIKAIKQRVKAQVAPLEAEKDQLKAQIEQIEAQYKAEEQALRAQLEPLKAQADALEGDAKKQFKATYIDPLEAQLRQLREQKEAQLAPLKARSDALKAQIEQTWTDAFANPDCGGA